MKILKGILAGVLLAVSSLVWAASIDINTADAKALETLNGIGPAKAAAIVEYRSKNGPFKSVDDLEKVPGIGASTISKNRDSLSIGGKVSAAAKPAAK